MKPAQSLSIPPSLAELASEGKFALFLDFDGTLVDIAPSPDAIRVAPGLAEALERLALKLEGRLALVSGRSLGDLHRHLGALRVACAGSHGIERVDAHGAPVGPAPQPFQEDVLMAMRDFARSHDEMGFEPKQFGAALHFRARPEMGPLAIAFAEEIAGQAGLALKHGSCVVEVLHHGADKSAAVKAFMQLSPFQFASPIFVGDDLTDEDGFQAARRMGGFGVLVGNSTTTGAQFRLTGPRDVHQWLGFSNQ